MRGVETSENWSLYMGGPKENQMSLCDGGGGYEQQWLSMKKRGRCEKSKEKINNNGSC